MDEAHRRQRAGKFRCTRVARQNFGVADAILAVHLFDYKFAVHADRHCFGMMPCRCFQPGTERVILGLIVRGDAQELSNRRDHVAVFAQGPIGLCATAGARLKGASRIFAIESVPSRARISRQLGAEIVIDHTVEDPVAAIMRLTGGRGVDVSIEALGSQDTFELALKVLRPGGVLSSLGVYSGKLTMPLDAFHAGLGDIEIVSTLCPGGKERMRRLMSVVGSGAIDLRPLVTHRFKLDQIEAASEGKLDNALKFDKIKALPHEEFNRVPADLVDTLATRSWDRRKASDKFKEPDLQTVPASYLYSDSEGSHFLDQDNFETLTLAGEMVGNALDLLLDGRGVRVAESEGVELHGVVDAQVGGDQRVDPARILARALHGRAHGGEVDDGGDAGEVLHEDPGRQEGQLGVGRGRLGPRGERGDEFGVP